MFLSPLVAEVLEDLGLPQTRPDFLFRGKTVADLTGPYVSQFLYLPYSNGLLEITQKYRTYLPGGRLHDEDGAGSERSERYREGVSS